MENIALYYHQRTKHHLNRLAKSLGYLDWENQPEPFRFYQNTTKIELPLNLEDPNCIYKALYKRELCKANPINLNTISKFLELSLGLSAWKSIPGSQWSLRINPSSGNLHPTESYLIIPDYDGLKGVYHYNPFLHLLEERAKLTSQISQKIKDFYETDGFFVTLTSIFWREAWKYGERAYRYSQLDIGHAIATMAFSASLQGWKVIYLNAVSDKEIEKMLGFDKTVWEEEEKEYPEGLFFIYKNNTNIIPDIPPNIVNDFSKLEFKGKPNKLSKEHVRWEIIEKVAKFVEKPRTKPKQYKLSNKPILWLKDSPYTAPQIIKKRRSAVAYDRKTYIEKQTFFHILDKTVPREKIPPFDTKIYNPSINLLLYIHRIYDLPTGLYFFFRYEEDKVQIINKTRKEFLWEKVSDELELYLLYTGNFELTSKIVSCRQDIAGDSSFSLSMISKFSPIIQKEPWAYRNIHWEAGMIGQVLYLEAEAHSLRGTGIGCFFDDAIHEVLGLKDDTYQTIYNFTVGGFLEDSRLRTFPPYYHIKDTR
ncbi:MAG: SagB/ThcOx family dehydrogenase [Aquificae bacterium]|nr:SagB/ThcOx family dehydrogenase [Aquificota bacterium]